jgi:MscS family membrane protein
MELENYTARDQIFLKTILGLRYETSPDQLRYVIAEIRKLLVSHERVTEPERVRFINFGAYSLDLEIFAYVNTIDWNEFLQIREDIYLRIIDIIDQSGTGFAFPSQTVYMGRDCGLDEENTTRVNEEIAKLREKKSVPIPDYTEDEVKQMRGSIHYPAEESKAVNR